jgi:23S rRNA pseudouridine2605 synthase
MNHKERLQKIIAASGLMSRRTAEEAILGGRVRLNGVVVLELGTKADLKTDVITVDELPLPRLESHRTFLFYKPRGVMTTKKDPEGRPTIMDYFQDIPAVNPAGRLDYESEGLLILTTDGDLLLRLTHPRYQVKKVYEVTTDRRLTKDQIEKLCTGIELSDGPGKFDSCEKLDEKDTYRVTISEGRNRFIRRMIAACDDNQVVRLLRTQMGSHLLGDLAFGERREIFPDVSELESK